MTLSPSMQQKLQSVVDRHEELEYLLGDAEVIQDQNKFYQYSKEYNELSELAGVFRQYQKAKIDFASAEALQQDTDPQIQALAKEELAQTKMQLNQLEDQLKILLLPQDPHDKANVFLEIRAGTGGEEAALFASDLFKMYVRYAEKQGWQVEIISESLADHGGFKEIIARIIGSCVYSQLKFESGAHRVQRVPETESQGRIHTSACTVAIMPEIEIIDQIELNPKDLKVDTFRASGAGGQHVNRTDSAIRITHIPTGTVVECQDERSQHKNRARAMSLLQARILDAQQQKQQQEQAATRKSLVGSGDRSERIRTYNYPQGRVTDHRINLTLYKLENIMQGELAEVINPLLREHQAQQLVEFTS